MLLILRSDDRRGALDDQLRRRTISVRWSARRPQRCLGHGPAAAARREMPLTSRAASRSLGSGPPKRRRRFTLRFRGTPTARFWTSTATRCRRDPCPRSQTAAHGAERCTDRRVVLGNKPGLRGCRARPVSPPPRVLWHGSCQFHSTRTIRCFWVRSIRRRGPSLGRSRSARSWSPQLPRTRAPSIVVA